MARICLSAMASCLAMILGLAVVGTASAAKAPDAKSLNVVLIYADDLGYGDLSCYGGDIPTPHIDSIARDGVRFTNWYVTAPACTPSRYSLLTGRMPIRSLGGLDRVLMPTNPNDQDHGLRPDEPTVAALLKRAGYRTAIIGKWHLGGHGNVEQFPTRRGFDYFYGFTAGCIDYFDLKYGHMSDWFRNEKQLAETGYSTDLMTADAVRLLKQQAADKPFFLYLPYNAPHYGKGWDDEKKQFKNILQAKPEDLKAFDQMADENRRVYSAMVKALDDGVGAVLQAIDNAKLQRNTLVVFISDNGADPRHGGDNGSLRGQKGTLFEGGIRVPCVMRWPGYIRPDTTVDEPCSTLDMLPTLCGLSGVDTAGLTLDGTDLGSLLCGKVDAVPERHFFWTYGNTHAVRGGPWKLFSRRSGKPMLFHLGKDPNEKTDLAAEHPDKVAELQAAYKAMCETVGR